MERKLVHPQFSFSAEQANFTLNLHKMDKTFSSRSSSIEGMSCIRYDVGIRDVPPDVTNLVRCFIKI